jgi:uncharacterized membrane protein
VSSDSPSRFVHHGAFGNDRFGVTAERFARFFGTPRFILGQTVLVVIWIALNAAAFSFRWDPYPFILLNLAFSTQAAYATPLILLAQTRQAESATSSATPLSKNTTTPISSASVPSRTARPKCCDANKRSLNNT